MKKFVLTLVAMVCLSWFSFGEDIDGAFGIKFGMSPAEAEAVLLAKGLTKAYTSPDRNQEGFEGGTFNGVDVKTLMVFFNEGKVYLISFGLGPIIPVDFISTFQKLSDQIKAKYPEADFRDNTVFSSPYKMGDGHEIMALRLGYAKLSNSWKIGQRLIGLLNDQAEAFDDKATGLELSFVAGDLYPPDKSDL